MNCIRSFTDLKEQRQLHYEPACQKDTKEGDKEIQGVVITGDPILPFSFFFFLMFLKADRFLSSGSDWDRASRARLNPNVIEKVTSELFQLV